MLKNVLLIVCLCSGAFAKGQCVAKAGSDQHWCRTLTNADTLQLGGDSSGTNTSGWQFQWFVQPLRYSSTLVFYASDFLDDTTLANPTLLDMPTDSITFYLRVTTPTDSCLDSCLITQTRFAQHFGTFSHYPALEDTFQLIGPNISPIGNYTVDSIEWLPHTYLIDPYVTRPFSVATADISYRTVIHSNGCTDTGAVFQYVYVNPLNREEQLASKPNVYPNPVENNTIRIEWPGQEGNVRLFSLSGKVLFRAPFRLSANAIEINLAPGVYILSLESSSGKSYRQPLVVK